MMLFFIQLPENPPLDIKVSPLEDAIPIDVDNMTPLNVEPDAIFLDVQVDTEKKVTIQCMLLNNLTISPMIL